jgi:hypothetical protein
LSRCTETKYNQAAWDAWLVRLIADEDEALLLGDVART